MASPLPGPTEDQLNIIQKVFKRLVHIKLNAAFINLK